jgi:hypothetical protein
MADNLKGIPFSNDDEGKTFPEVAKRLVYDEALRTRVRDTHPTFSADEVYVVWFAYVLGYWKALCSTSLPDGRYYEVTYHAQRKVAFIDTYVKVENQEVEIS